MPTKGSLDVLLDQYEPAVAAAFRKAMSTWRTNLDLAALVRAISNHDVGTAVLALHLDPAALQRFLDELAAAYRQSGERLAGTFPRLTSAVTGARFTIGFNGRDPVAEAWLRQQSSSLIADITHDQKDAVQLVLEAGLREGVNPNQVALDIVGRIDASGVRQGGVIGLSPQQAQFLLSAKAELSSIDPALLRNYLTRELRDRRFDTYVLAAIENGKAIDADVVTKMLVSYSNRLLNLRGEVIARTETLPALHAAENEAIRQAISAGGIKASAVSKVWKSARDSRVRDTHRSLHNQRVPFNRPFVSPSGARLMYPGDKSLGAPIQERANCRCIAETKIDFFAGVK